MVWLDRLHDDSVDQRYGFDRDRANARKTLFGGEGLLTKARKDMLQWLSYVLLWGCRLPESNLHD